MTPSLKRLGLLSLLWVGSSLSLFAQDSSTTPTSVDNSTTPISDSSTVPSSSDSSLDSLFDNPPADAATPPEAAPPRIDHTQAFIQSNNVQWSGSYNFEAGVGMGWQNWPNLSNLGEGLKGTVGGKAGANIVLNAKPDDTIRIYWDLGATFDPATTGTFNWSTFTINQLYGDYYGIPGLFLRIGKHIITWGQARLFTPGDLMTDSQDGIAFHASFPALLSGVSLIALAKDSFFSNTKNPSTDELAYAGKADMVVGPLLVSAGGRFQKVEGLRSLFSLKTVFLSTDLLMDAVVRDLDGQITYTIVSGFYRDWKNYLFYGEYQYDTTVGSNDHSIAIATLINNVFDSPFNFGVKWYHTWFDESGSVTVGMAWSPKPHFTLQAAVPITYGAETSRYVVNNEDPGKRRIALALLLTIAGSF